MLVNRDHYVVLVDIENNGFNEITICNSYFRFKGKNHMIASF